MKHQNPENFHFQRRMQLPFRMDSEEQRRILPLQ